MTLSLRSLVSLLEHIYIYPSLLYLCCWNFSLVDLFSLQIDHSFVESFGAKGKTCITSRVYPTLAVLNAAHLHVFNNGTETVTIKKLNAWSMKRAQID